MTVTVTMSAEEFIKYHDFKSSESEINKIKSEVNQFASMTLDFLHDKYPKDLFNSESVSGVILNNIKILQDKIK